MPTFCSNCGVALADRDAFCSACGNPVEPGWGVAPVRPLSEPRYSIVGAPISPTQEESAEDGAEHPPSRRSTFPMNIKLVLLGVVALVFGWHMLLCLTHWSGTLCEDVLFGAASLSNGECRLSVSVTANPFTDVITMRFPSPAQFGITDRAMAEGWRVGFRASAAESAENVAHHWVRDNFDLYAMLLPYSVTVEQAEERPAQAPDMPRPASAAHDSGVGARDDWKQWETRSPAFDLDAHLTHSLADAPLTSSERSQIYKVIDDKTTHESSTDSQREEQETMMSARVGFIGLAEDGSQQVLVKGPESPDFCGASGNCPIWIFIRRSGRLQLALETGGQVLVLRAAFSQGFRDLATGWHMGAGKEDFSVYRWNGAGYDEVDCYEADINSNPPLITDCKK